MQNFLDFDFPRMITFVSFSSKSNPREAMLNIELKWLLVLLVNFLVLVYVLNTILSDPS